MGNPANKLETIQSALNKQKAAAITEIIPLAQTLFLPYLDTLFRKIPYLEL